MGQIFASGGRYNLEAVLTDQVACLCCVFRVYFTSKCSLELLGEKFFLKRIKIVKKKKKFMKISGRVNMGP